MNAHKINILKAEKYAKENGVQIGDAALKCGFKTKNQFYTARYTLKLKAKPAKKRAHRKIEVMDVPQVAKSTGMILLMGSVEDLARFARSVA